jgi:integrase
VARPKRQVVVRFRQDRGKWEVDYLSPAGVSPRRPRPLFPTEEAALAHAAEVVKALNETALIVEDRNTLLGQYVQKWLHVKAHEVEARTLATHEACLTRYVLPALGHLRIRDLRRRHVKALVFRMREKGYAPDTIRLARAALSSVLSAAVDDEIVTANVSLRLGIKLTRGKPTMRPMTREQRDAFLEEAMKKQPHGALFTVMAKAGLRPSEAYALQPGDVDWNGATLRVERALDRDRTAKETKTHEQRDVELSPGLVRTLRRHLVWLKEQALALGWGEPVWLFPNETGATLDESKVRKVFRRTLRRAGLPSFRVYDCRHTFASLLLSMGATIVYVAAQMGHKSPATTWKWYAKYIPGTGKRWVDTLDLPSGEAEGRGTRFWNQNELGDSRASEVRDSIGEPSGTRTRGPLIKALGS